MKRQIRVFWLAVVGSVLAFSFQNCGGAAFDSSDYVKDAPLSSITGQGNVGDTQYKEGFSFNLLSSDSAQTKTKFRASKTDDGQYRLLDENSVVNCSLDDATSIEDLLQFSESVKVSNPLVLSEIPEVCQSTDGSFQHLKIGDQSPIYLIPADEQSGCLLDEPSKLIAEGKRVFIIENISFDEIESMIAASKASSQNEGCRSVSLISVD